MQRQRPTLFYWSEHTASKPAGTGIERVVRCLGRALQELGIDIVPVGWDGERRLLRVLSDGERDQLGLGARSDRFVPRQRDWLLVPEFPAQAINEGCDPIALGHAYGLRTAALVHDLIPLKFPHLYDPVAVDFYRRCFEAFAGADRLLATTRYVAADLARWPAHKNDGPAIAICPLSGQLPSEPRRLGKPPLPDAPLRLLTVSRWEPRKNLPRLLRAFELLANLFDPPSLGLTVVGRRGGFPAYEAEVEARIDRLPNVTVLSDVGDGALATLHETHHACVYPSYEEGFGLPILESLWLATPCICHAGSAMAEVAPGGGTVMIDMLDEGAIASALADLAATPARPRALSDEAIARDLPGWSDTARAVASSLDLLSPRASRSREEAA